MALPTTGQISIGDIVNEKSEAQGNDSLLSLSTTNVNQSSTNKPDGVAPHAISEFYGYNHSAVTLTSYGSSTIQSNPANACSQTIFGTYYHDGSGITPVNGDSVFSDAKGQNSLGDGSYRFQASPQGYYNVSSGVVSGTGGCRSERRLKKNIEYIGTSPMGIPIYHFEYKNPEHAPNGMGRYVGTMVDELQRLGLSDTLFTKDGDVWVDYNKLDIDCKLV